MAAFFSGVIYALALNTTIAIGLFALASLAGAAHSRRNRVTVEDVMPPEMLDYYGIVVVANCKAVLEMVRTIERHDQGSFHQAHNLWRIEAAKAPKVQ